MIRFVGGIVAVVFTAGGLYIRRLIRRSEARCWPW